jgi:hypothetical protein
MQTLVKKIKEHFAGLGYVVDIKGHQVNSINEEFSHDVIFLKGESSIRLFRLIKKYFGEQVDVISTNKTRIIIFRFNPDGHTEVTGVCKVCGCSEELECRGNCKCYWTEGDLCIACHDQLPAAPQLKKLIKEFA